MTISSLAASRRYRERSSLTFARATRFGLDTLFRKPGFRLLLRDDGKDFNDTLRDVIKHPDFSDSEPVLRTIQATQALDAALADLPGLVPQVELQGLSNTGSDVGAQGAKILDRLRGKDDLESHLARL